ncbi:MAG: hypothetical protein Q4G05_02055 [Clostridia bacterium]|nr:hypothetical protein [Clostridia bacterium]
MVSLTVINIRDIIKYFFKTILMLIVVVIAIRVFSNIKNKSVIESKKHTFLTCLNQTIPLTKQVNTNTKDEGQEEVLFKEDFFKNILSINLSLIGNVDKINEASNDHNESLQEDIAVTEQSYTEQEIKLANENLQTQVQESGIEPKFTNEHSGVQIKNETRI